MKPSDLLHPTPKGLYCPPGDFYIDPVAPVERALVTHGHADHARSGHTHCMATRQTLDIMALRYGADHARHTQVAEIGEVVDVNGVDVAFFPAGHVLGSAQILVEHARRGEGGTRIVASGDYKRRRDPTCRPFEPVACDVFITEATFALPVFRHPDDRDEIAKLVASVRQFPESAHIVGAYALGKAQRIIKLVREAGHDAPIYIHGAMKKLCDYYESQGIDLGELRPATIETGKGSRGRKDQFAGSIVVGPPSAMQDKWARRFPEPVTCFASGWMRVRQRARQRGVELPLIVSDHCDWDELLDTILEIRPAEVWVTHGRDDALVRWCALNDIPARPLHLVGYDDENE